MGNKRVSQLTPMTAPEINSDDLFLIIDTSVAESKKILVSQLASFLSVSGSLIASHATTSDTASYILGSNVYGPVPTATYATTAGTATSATSATSADTAISASYAKTSSWAVNVVNGSTLITGATYPITSSWSEKSTTSNIATTAVNLLYIPGVSKNTASYALSASISNRSITASFAELAKTASYALFTQTIQSITDSASFLVFSPNNGTASYAIRAGNAGLTNYGMFLALEQSSSFAMLDDVSVFSSLTTPQETTIQAIGTAILIYTSSVFNTNSLNLRCTNRLTGVTSSFDATQVSYNVTPVMNRWDDLSSGSFHIPFDLVGQESLYGNYLVEVISSDSRSLQLDTNKTVRFLISSYSDVIDVSTGSLVDLYIVPTSSLGGGANITFSSIIGGPFYDSLSGLLSTGSSNILAIDISSRSISEVSYPWKCSNLTDFSCSSNPSLTRLNYSFPNSLENLYCSTCSITTIADLSNTQLVNLDCNNNQLYFLPALPNTLVNLNSSNNPLIFSPATWPLQLNVLYCNETSLTIPSLSSSINLLTASFVGGITGRNNLNYFVSLPEQLEKLIVSNNPSLFSIYWPGVSITASLPLSMSYLNATSCSLFSLPSMSISMSYLNISHNPSLPAIQTENATYQLISNGQYTGSYIRLGDGNPSLITKINLITLSSSYGWNIQHDGFP